MNKSLDDLDLRPGDKVNITHMNIVVEDVTFDNCIRYRKPDRTVAYHRIDNDTTVYVVERAERFPEHWPPQKGDVWTDGITVAHVLASGIYDVDGGVFPNRAHFIRNHPNMKLVYRRGNVLR